MRKKGLVLFVLFMFLMLSVPSLVLAQEGAAQNVKEVAVAQIDTAKNLLNMIMEFFVKYSFHVLGGVIVLVLGWLIGGRLAKFTSDFLVKKGIDVTVSKFISGTVKFLVVLFAFIVALGKFGIDIAPLIAGISVVGFGMSFALQGPLSNYAAGITLIFTKPFKVGDIIEVAGVNGEVLDMKLPRTDVRTVDGERVFIPNKHIIGEVIHNFSDLKRVDILVGVSYSTDINKSIEIVRSVIKANDKVTKDKEPKVGVSEFADSSVNIAARLWCKQEDYWDTMFSVNKEIFDELNKSGIEIPFPQRDVHIIQEGKEASAV